MNETTVMAPADIDADFTLRCDDDSMMNARLFKGDIVFVRFCEDVEDGQIAVIQIGEDYCLKRVYHGSDYLELRAENSKYPTMFIRGTHENVKIIGKVVKAWCNVN